MAKKTEPSKQQTTPSVAKLAAITDEWWAMREKRLAADKIAADLKAKEAALEKYLLENIPASGATGISASSVAVEVKEDEVPSVGKDGWNSFFAYVSRYKAYDLLQRRLSTKAVMERLEDGKSIPGVELVPVRKLSYTRR